ncbi:sigma 54-interacting transcriptional regulator [Paraburkholderia sp. LEh10]|uniref:sigma 54-interacting transcriptional regulator n=1 Tax=Paraburkholderia sp. LEh10 TaxID=2821353 RepID=UPI001AE1C3EE
MLLRMLEDNAVTRIGSAMSVKLDFGSASATNESLQQPVRDGTSRAVPMLPAGRGQTESSTR